MQFEHLVEINPQGVAHLTRDQVWRGLLRKAEDPLLFVEALDHCTLLARDGDTVSRELRFGGTTFRDRVTFLPPDRVRQVIVGPDDSPGAVLESRIEMTASGALAVRFSYLTPPDPDGGPDSDLYAGFVRQAYVQADTHAIEVIRRLAAAGML
jgi:hypothetical protein